MIRQFRCIGNVSKLILKYFGLEANEARDALIPLGSSKCRPVAPSVMTAAVHFGAQESNQNIIYPYPFGIMAHFPVMFCKFLDIVRNRVESLALDKYVDFMKKRNFSVLRNIDQGVQELTKTLLSYKSGMTEQRGHKSLKIHFS